MKVKKEISQTSKEEIIPLNVSYEEKEIVKPFGAKWDRENRTWYATRQQLDIHPRLRDFLPYGSPYLEDAENDCEYER